MLKLVFWILLLINGALFAYRQGYLDTIIPPGREPARLAQQFNTDKIRLLPANAKPADHSAPAEPAAPADKPAAAPGDDKTGNNADSNADKSDAPAPAAKAGAAVVADARGEAGKVMNIAHNPDAEKKPEPEKKAELDKKAETAKLDKKSATDPKADSNKKADPDKKGEAADKTAAADKKSEALACTEIGNFNEADAARFEARLAALTPGARVSHRQIREASSHIVFIPPQGSKEAADRKVEQLRSLGVTDFYIMQDQSEMRWGISLGVFSSEESAKKRLEQLKQQGVRTARVGPRNTVSKLAVQVRALDAASRDKLEKLKSDFPQQQQHSCT